jgi:hypothetical protein
MITATVTRPTTISPTITCDRKIYFVERIDISPLYPPKSRTITLEPVSRRKVAKEHARKLVDPADRKSRKTDSASRSDPQRNSNSTAPSTGTDSEPPMSPSPSNMSYESAVSGSNAQSQVDSSSQSQSTSTDTRPNDSRGSVAVKNITTEVESCVGGCLRGDSIPVKVSVNHVKHIKSMNGVIVTLFRQARVDMHPAIPLGPTEKSKNPKYEDYYPRSKTGLGGLSLSGAGSSHMFRKDLSQTVQPLIVDPGSLLSEVTVKVRVPEDAFPTISTVPGAMISFKYYVEVVVDIQGRLGAQERAMAGLTGMTSMTMSGGDDLENERGGMTASGAYMVDTAPVRRDKGVVSATFEVVIGTRDSERRKGKQKEEETPVIPEEPPVVAPSQREETTNVGAEQHYPSHPSEDDYWGYNYYDWTHGDPNGYDHWDYHRFLCLTYRTTRSFPKKSGRDEQKSVCFQVNHQVWISKLEKAHTHPRRHTYQGRMFQGCMVLKYLLTNRVFLRHQYQQSRHSKHLTMMRQHLRPSTSQSLVCQTTYLRLYLWTTNRRCNDDNSKLRRLLRQRTMRICTLAQTYHRAERRRCTRHRLLPRLNKYRSLQMATATTPSYLMSPI